MRTILRRWLPVVVWIAVIYTTIPFVRSLSAWFVGRWDPSLIGWAVATILVVSGLAAMTVIGRRRLELRRGGPVWVIAVTTLLVVWTFNLRRSPEEAVHLLEYGALALLLHRALRPSLASPWVYLAGALAGALIGTADEVIQWFSPNRYWDWRDLLLNAGAGGLVQLALWRVLPDSDPAPTGRSSRIPLRLGTALVLVLTLCLSNTPRVVARYASLIPGAGHLTSTLNPMAEYGHFHVAPGIGSFKSRLTLEEMATADRLRSAEVAEIIDAHKRNYGEFLDTWPVAEDPFTYEVRVHIFARDRNVGKAREREFSGAAAKEALAVAWHENRLLEERFGQTLDQSSYVWKNRLRRRVETSMSPGYDFHSAAGSHLITFASEGAIRTLLLALAALLVVVDLLLRRAHRSPS